MMKTDASRVILTSLGTLLGRVSGILAFVVLTPLLFSGLGERLFGIYQFAQRLSAFGGLSNLGASGYLKIRLSELSRSEDAKLKREAVAECIGQWVALIPLLGIWLWVIASLISRREPLSISEQAAVTALLCLTPVAQLFSIGHVALFSAGLGYRGALVLAALSLGTAAVAALAAQLRLGLVGVTGAMWLGAVVTAVYTTALAKRHLPWFGASWPGWLQFRASFGASWGAALASLAYLGLQQVEALSFGFALGPAVLGQMVLTCAGVQCLELIVRSFIGATGFTLAPAVRDRDLTRLQRLRCEAHASIALLFALAAGPIVFLSPWILRVWVPGAPFLGHGVVAAVLVVAYFRVLAQFDGVLLDQARSFHRKTLLATVLVFAPAAAAALIGATTALVGWYWILPAAMAIYYLVLSREFRRVLPTPRIARSLIVPALAAPAAALVAAWAHPQGQLGLDVGRSVAVMGIVLVVAAADANLRAAAATAIRRLLRIAGELGRGKA